MSTTGLTNADASFRGSRGFLADVDRDLLSGLRAWRLWTMLGWNDIRQRYRRSVLGPFWITISMAVFISLLGVIYSHIFKIELRTYLPYLSLGYIIWGFVSQTTGESSISFQESERIIRQIRLPYSIFVLRVVWRNFIVFLHTIVIFVPIAIIYDVRPGFTALLALPGLALVYINQVWVTLALAIICTRYRDVQQIVSTAIQITLFATPIMWPVNALGSAVIIAYVNPLYHMMELVRAPMLGDIPSKLSWVTVTACAMVGWTIAILLLRRATRRLVFWL
ncbi:MAG TPA: ABC transporter permease [Candidatus Acidoferrum sp.]|nr:ABC transporter permease [Candidatus Acidoferrum sp.]